MSVPTIGCSTEIMSAASVTGVAPCLMQAVRALRARIERRARYRKHFAALLERKPRGDQRARALRGLDDDDAERQPGNQPVAPREIARARLPAERHFATAQRLPAKWHRAARHAQADRARSWPPASTAIVPVARLAAMGGGVDAAREAGDNGEAGLAKLRGDALR